ncbi:MAG TPA: glycerophosphodiester phosphodiesterase family protein [Mucilaginibacter sp.]|nr:glycerophosphodiester phosphodiesterase family protein [Mucilaginibacter sp.]
MKKLILLLAACGLLSTAYAQPNPPPPARHPFIVISHRGDHVKYPENTLEGYAEAIKNEADYVEIDLRTTKDGELVSMHDGTVNRMTEGKGNVKDMTLAEIEQLHVKSRDSLGKATYRVPTFKQILDLCKDKIYIYIDFKNADASLTYDMLKQYGMEKQVLVYINNPQQFTDWRNTAPDMPLMVSLPGNVKDETAMKAFIDKTKPDILDGNWKEYTKEMVSSAMAMGLTVWPDIQSANESQDWEQALAKGFTGLQTDHPADLVRFLKSKGLR